MLRDQPDDLLPHVVAIQRMHVEAIEKCPGRRDALFLVIHRSNAPIDHRRRRRLAEVVTDGAQHDGDLLRAIEIVDAPPRLIHDLQRVDPHVAFGMPFRFLRASRERLQLGEQRAHDAQLHREGQPNRRSRGQQQLFDLSPDPLGRQIVERRLATQRARGLIKRQLEPRRELHRAQHTQTVIAECRRVHHTEKPALDVAPAVAWVEVLARQRIPGDRIDREVAPPYRVAELHRRIAGDVEAAVPATGFRFASRQRDVDIARLVDLEAFADGLDAAERLEQVPQSIGRHAEDFEVDIFGGIASRIHEAIAHPAAHDERATAGVAYAFGDVLCTVERIVCQALVLGP